VRSSVRLLARAEEGLFLAKALRRLGFELVGRVAVMRGVAGRE